MLRLKTDGGRLLIGNATGGEPDVEETFGEEAVDTLVIGTVMCRVKTRLEGEEDGEKPMAVVVEEVAAHDEHIADMRAPCLHVRIESRKIPRCVCGDALAQKREVAGVMCVHILGGIRLDEVVPPPRQKDRRLRQGALEVSPRVDALRAAAESRACKMAAIVYQAEIVIVREIFPCPVERGQLAERAVLPADVLSRVVTEERRPRLMQGTACLYGEIHVILRYPVWFMRCNQHTDSHASYHLFLSCLWITMHYISTNAPPYKTSL